jgi:LysM repeat protein
MKFRITILTALFFSTIILHAQMTPQQYIEKYSDIAVSEMNRTGIPASITMAQGILESGSGNSYLAKEAKNHFGIKCHGNWSGETVTHDDDQKNECFRKYSDVKASFDDHSDFIKNGSRYQFLFEYKSTDYKNWAKGLQKAGYATNKKYADKLIELIERYDLHKLDIGVTPVLAEKTTTKNEISTTDKMIISSGSHPVMERNRVQYTVAKRGDTYESLTAEFDKMRWELRKYNDVPDGIEPEAGQIVYLQPKRNKTSRKHKIHVVSEGETMWFISQKYAVRLIKLYKRNQLDPGAEPDPGTNIYLRGRKH